MKQKWIAGTLALVLLAATALSGCGAASSPMMNDRAAAEPSAPAAAGDMADMPQTKEAVDQLAGGTLDNAAFAQRKIIKNVSLSLETLEFDAAVDEITALVERMGGYIEYSDVSGNSLRDSGGYSSRYASFSARVPSDKLTAATDELGTLCNVRNRSESVSDITDNYYDVDGRLGSLRVQEERLLSMMEAAEKLEDMITIESALSEVRYQIESLTGQLQRMDSQVDYSTLNIELSEVVEYSELRNQPKNFGERVSEAFAGSLDFIASFGQSLVLFLVAALPFIIVYGGMALILVLIVLAIAKAARKRRAARAAARGELPPTPPTPPTAPGALPESHQYHPSTPGGAKKDETPKE